MVMKMKGLSFLMFGWSTPCRKRPKKEETMKAINLKKTINKAKSLAALSLALLALALTGCQQAADSGDMALALAGAQTLGDGGQAYVTLSLANKVSASSAADGVSASALPDPAQAVFGRFELSGISSQQGVSPVSWSCGDGKSDARQELDGAKVSVKKGAAYNFTLTATTLGGAQYSDTIPYTVQDQGNLLSFNLRLLSVGTGSGQGQQGSAAITVNLPSGGKGGQVNRVAASVYKLNDDGSLDNDPVAGFDNIDVPIESGAANFNASIDAGVYCAVFDLYGGEDGKILLGTWREYFGVAEGQTSASTLNPAGGADGDQVDEVHSITYNKNDDTIDPALVSAPESFSRLTVRTLKQIKDACLRANYRIHSWYMDKLLTQEFSSTVGINSDLALWAKWDTLLFIKIPDRYEHGSATAKPEGDDQGNPAIAGEEVTITPSPDDGWVTGDITITAVDSAGNELNPQPDGYPKTIDRATTPKTFDMPDLSYCQGVKVDVDFLATVTFAENKSAGAAADDTASSSGSMQPQIFAVNTPQALSANGFAIVGWTFAGWNTAADASGTSYADGADFTTDAPITLYAQWTPNADTEYKVQHYKQKADLTDYELVGADTETKTGTTWTDTNVTSADAKDYDGFAIKAGSPANAKIKADGSAVVPIYYDRNSYTVSVSSSEHGSLASDTASVQWGRTVTLTITEADENFELDTVSVTTDGGQSVTPTINGTTVGSTITFTMPVGNVSVAATFADLKFDGTKETAGRIVVYNKNLDETRYVAQADWDKEKYQTKGGWIPVAIVFGQVGTHYYGVSLVNSGQLKYSDSQAFVDGYGSAHCAGLGTWASGWIWPENDSQHEGGLMKSLCQIMDQGSNRDEINNAMAKVGDNELGGQNCWVKGTWEEPRSTGGTVEKASICCIGNGYCGEQTTKDTNKFMVLLIHELP